jgi:DNA (cytosine-5)-methyltransferase 1
LFGYPDDFIFEGSITEVRRQIGNSVPPVAANVVAEKLMPIFQANTEWVINRKEEIDYKEHVKTSQVGLQRLVYATE